MIYEQLSDDELLFMELYYTPTAMIENLFPENLNAPKLWSADCQCVTIRPYQYPMVNYSYMYADDDKLSPKDNFRKKIGAGEAYNISARNIGKSYLFLNMDACLAVVYMQGDESCIASFDAKHLKNVTEKIASIVEGHKFFEMFHLKGGQKKSVARDPHTIQTITGHLQKGVNENINSPDPGVGFHSLHYKLFHYEEASYMSQEGTEKRVDSGHSHGYIQRLSGIPDLRMGSPLQKLLQNSKKRNWTIRLPQLVREDWDEVTKASMVEKYGGENSTAYKLNVLGEILEGAYGFWDMQRIRQKSYKEDRAIKFFEVSKENLWLYDKRIVIERYPGEQCYICSDIGSGASPSEILILFGNPEKYKAAYNISLFKLTAEEQAMIFHWVWEKLSGGIIAVDATDGTGRSIAEHLVRLGVPSDNIIQVKFNENIEIDFAKDITGKVLLDEKGKPIVKKENTIEYAMQRLEHLLYSGILEVPRDEKFLKEFAGYIVRQNGARKSFGSTTTDHYHQSFQVFAIAQFLTEMKVQNKLTRTKRALVSLD